MFVREGTEEREFMVSKSVTLSLALVEHNENSFIIVIIFIGKTALFVP